MMFSRIAHFSRRAPTMKKLMMATAVLCFSPAAFASGPVAIVPNEVIYPGQDVDLSLLREVEVTNPNIRPDYISSWDDLEGTVARRTLLPGHVIPMSAIREAYAVERGSDVTLVFSAGGLTITAPGRPLESAAIGDSIEVRNTETGVTVSGLVMADGSVRVVTQ
jgi:flagella basal body P-ring formation protein FlgA